MTTSSSELEQSEQSTLWSQERPVSPFQLPGSEEDWAMTVATWPSDSARLLTSLLPPGSFGKMSQGYSAVTEDGTLVPSSGRWSNAAMGSPTAFSMLSFSESPNAAEECSLSDTLEIGDLPQRYYLSATACSGILRRARKRGKKLPGMLEEALRKTAQT